METIGKRCRYVVDNGHVRLGAHNLPGNDKGYVRSECPGLFDSVHYNKLTLINARVVFWFAQ